MHNEMLKTNVYWITTILGSGLLLFGGILFITHGEQQLAEMKHLGYPIYFLILLGIGRFIGAITILIPRFPRLKEWAYAGIVIDLTAASASHAFAGDGLAQIASPLILLALVAASWATALRMKTRRMKRTSTNAAALIPNPAQKYPTPTLIFIATICLIVMDNHHANLCAPQFSDWTIAYSFSNALQSCLELKCERDHHHKNKENKNNKGTISTS